MSGFWTRFCRKTCWFGPKWLTDIHRDRDEKCWSREACTPIFEISSQFGACKLELRASKRPLIIRESAEDGRGGTTMVQVTIDFPAGRGTAVHRISTFTRLWRFQMFDVVGKWRMGFRNGAEVLGVDYGGVQGHWGDMWCGAYH